MKYKTFLDILLLIALLSTVVIMTIDNVEATPSNYYRVSVFFETTGTHVDIGGTPAYYNFININGVRRITGTMDMNNFTINHGINTITMNGVDGYFMHHEFFFRVDIINATFRIYKNNTLVASGHGLGTHILNIPHPSIPILPPPPVFELPSPPVLTPPTSRPIFFNHTPVFFNYTVLFPFFDFIDWLFLPFAQVIIDILWIPLGILDFITNTLMGFWFFVDNHVVYTGLLGVLSFVYVFFEIPQVMLIMLLGLTLVVIKIYLKR